MPRIILDNLPYLLSGLALTLQISIAAAVLGTAIGVTAGVVRYVRAPYLSELAGIYITLVRGTPLLVGLLVCYFALPAAFGYRTSAVGAAIAAFALFAGAYIAEDVRGGLAAVPAGLSRSALATGLTPFQTLRLVVLPIGLRTAVPAVFNQYVRLFKFTSLASIIGVNELTGRALLVNARDLQPVAVLAALAATYFVFCFAISRAGRWVHGRLA